MDERYHQVYPELYRHHWWWRAREEFLLQKISGLLVNAPQTRILDVGCGAGLFFDTLQQFGCVEGIEPSATAVADSAKWRGSIHIGELDGTYQSTEPYDLVIMLDVLEHVREPELLLRQAARQLAPGGYILATVPAFTWLWTSHDDVNQHFTRYSIEQLHHLFTTAGLCRRESGYFFGSLVAAKLGVRLIESVSKRSASPPRLPPSWLNSAAQHWFRTEHRIARWLPFGGSAWLVAQND